MGYTTSDFSNRGTRGKAEVDAADHEQEPIQLSYIFILGFMFSLLVVVGLIWIAAAYETGDPVPWSAERRMTLDETFGVIRNGVTAAAALGVGVTLFFSYRRQQTAERTLSYTAKTQRLAVEAQKLAEDRLEGESLDTLRKRYLEIATLLNSGTEFNRITALHALESLIISWRQSEDDREAAACLGLLLSTMRLSRSGRTAYDQEFLQTAQRLLNQHMGHDVEGALSWSELTFDASYCISPIGVRGWEIRGGDVAASPQDPGPLRLSLTRVDGSLRLSDNDPDLAETPPPNTVNNVTVLGGRLVITCTGTNPKTFFRSCSFDGGIVNVTSTQPNAERDLRFEFCRFNGGELRLAIGKPTTVLFSGCRFTRPPINRFWVKVRARTLIFRDCTAIDSNGEEIAVESLEDLNVVFAADIRSVRGGGSRSTRSGPANGIKA